MNALRTVAAYVGFIVLATVTTTAAALLLNEFVHPSTYSNNVGFYAFVSGLFGACLVLVAKHIFRRPY
jgi:uncharacterized membrane protein YeaQ/YmgE (transglycosylase-associated protein family)